MNFNESENSNFKKSFKDFVVTMCKNGVQHTQSLHIQATICITIDDKSVEIIQLNEKFYGNEYFPERAQINTPERNKTLISRVRGVCTPRARRGVPTMRRLPNSVPAKFPMQQRMISDSGIVPKRLNFQQNVNGSQMVKRIPRTFPPRQKKTEVLEEPLYNIQQQNSFDGGRPQTQNFSQNSSVICLDEEEDYSDNYNYMNNNVEMDNDNHNMSYNNNTNSQMPIISPSEFTSNELGNQNIKMELKMESTDALDCKYCDLEFQNLRALRTHLRQSHSDIQLSSTVENTSTFDAYDVIE